MISSLGSNEIGIYLTADDLLSAGWNEDVVDDGGVVTRRNNRALEALQKAIAAVLEAHPNSRAIFNQCTHEVDANAALLIAIDELGNQPQFLRALCSLGTSKVIPQNLGFRIPCSFMVAGTGVGEMNSPVGSLPSSYTILPLPSTDQVWNTLVKAVETSKKVMDGVSVLQVLQKQSTTARLAKNPRVAALMYRKLRTRNEFAFWSFLGNQPSPRAIENTLPLFFTEVARDFRVLNGMSLVVDTAELMDIYRQALAMVFYSSLPGKAENPKLITSYVTIHLCPL